MKKILGLWTMLALMLVGSSVISSCGPTLGPAFQKANNVPKNVGVVHIYRPPSVIGGGVYYDVKANQTIVTTLYNGGYFTYFATPGEIEFSAKTESTSSVTVDVKPGQIYYVKGTVGIGFVVGRPHLSLVSPEIAEKEIAECKLIPQETKQ